MSVLLRQEVERKPGKLSKSEIKKLGFLSHDENRESETVKKWCDLAKRSFKDMIAEMQAFLKSDAAITSVSQFPKSVQPCLEYVLDNKENFSFDAFFEIADLRALRREMKVSDDGTLEPKSAYAQLMERCADTILARYKTANFGNKNFDEKEAFKALYLIKDSLLVKEKGLRFSGTKYLEKPVVINMPCIINIDPCSQKIVISPGGPVLEPGGPVVLPVDPVFEPGAPVVQPGDPVVLPVGPSIGAEISTVRATNHDGEHEDNNDEDCPCEELMDKAHDCNCEKSSTDPCECECDDTCYEQNPCCAKIETFVSELYVVKEEVDCYKPGEIARIENVMIGESRVKEHRHLQREETYNETEEENNTFKERNTQIDERYALNKEIDKLVESELSVDAGVSYSSRAGNKKTYKKLSASLDVSYKQSKKDARKIVQDESKNIISSAIERVEKKVRTLSSTRMINEIEEKNTHTFDGAGFSDHENGIYFFVNKESKAQVYSYGVREMIDFYVPDPSLRLKSLLEKEFELEKPEKPCLNIEDINPEDYLKYIQCYGFTDLEKLADLETEISIPFDGGTGSPKQHIGDWGLRWYGSGGGSDTAPLVVPDGYEAVEMSTSFGGASFNGHDLYGSMSVTVSNSSLLHYAKPEFGTTRSTIPLKNLEGTHTITVNHLNLTSYSLKLIVKFRLKSEIIQKWQIDVYNRIMDKYNKELEAYNRALEEFNRNKQSKFNQNPFMLSETIKEQLKHSALEYITCQFFDAKNGMRNRVKPCGLPQMDIPETEEFAKQVRFWEQALEWKFMNYMLYPYFWADKCTWEDKLNEDAQNGLFKKFLQSGYARVSVSIRPGYEGMIDYFLTIGEIWNGAGTPPLSGINYLPIHQEIKESKDNFNSDRAGYLIWDSAFTPALNKDEIIVKGDGRDDYLDTVPSSPTFGQLDPFKVAKDINREVVIDCIVYRIVDVLLVNGEVILKLDRDLEHKDPTLCPNDFDDRYKDKNILWSTGAKFEGAAWKYATPTPHTWLKEDECLPCYPITCKEKC